MADYTYTVFVSSSVFVIDYESQAKLALGHDLTYRFDLSHSTNTGHTFRFSTISDGQRAGGTQYTTGYTTSGTPGSADAYVELAVDSSTYPSLHYYCSNHDAMGAKVATTENTYVETDVLGAKIPIAGNAEDVWASHLNAGVRKIDALASMQLSTIDVDVEIPSGFQAAWAGPIIVGSTGTLTISGTLVVL